MNEGFVTVRTCAKLEIRVLLIIFGSKSHHFDFVFNFIECTQYISILTEKKRSDVLPAVCTHVGFRTNPTQIRK